MVIDREEVIFVHIPKVAGVSIEVAMNNKVDVKKEYSYWFRWRRHTYKVNAQHAMPFEIQRVCGMRRWNNYYKFTFVRNPWSRFVSLFFHLRKVGLLNSSMTFEKFSECYFAHPREILIDRHINMGLPSINWIKGLDFVGKFETIEQDFEKLCKRLGKDWQLPHMNQSDHDHYSKYYDAKTKKQVEEFYKEDIEYFKYSF